MAFWPKLALLVWFSRCKLPSLAYTHYEGHQDFSYPSRSRPIIMTRKDRSEQCCGDPFINVDVQMQSSCSAAVYK